MEQAAESRPISNLTNGGHPAETLRLSKLSQFHSHPVQLNSNLEFGVVDNRSNSHFPIGSEGKQKKGKGVSTSIPWISSTVHQYQHMPGLGSYQLANYHYKHCCRDCPSPLEYLCYYCTTKGSCSVLHVPSTSMAARAIDDLVEIEMEENEVHSGDVPNGRRDGLISKSSEVLIQLALLIVHRFRTGYTILLGLETN
ncbi:hypothetical protein NC651_018796 [Populus alba x Populus x berolinensis]|nr:hypothetical protein NC651_018796 [Populus alba x Populus x berolinensis]